MFSQPDSIKGGRANETCGPRRAERRPYAARSVGASAGFVRTPGALRNNVAACHSGVLGCRSAAKGRLGVAAVERLMYQFFDVDAVLRGELNKH
jgi:hypothetical protein